MGGRAKRSRLYYGRLRLDGETKVQTIPLGVSDKGVAVTKLLQIRRERERAAVGLAVPQSELEAIKKPLSEHVAAFLADLKGKGRAHGTVKRYRTLLRVLFRECGWRVVRDITPASFSGWRNRGGRGPKYVNDVLGAALTFLTWMERRGWIPANPLRHVEKVRNDREGTYRRALSPAEVSRLLAVAPVERAWVYLVILYTGLRRHELNRLTWGHFHLDAPQPFVELPATITKNHKSDRLPLRPEVVAALVKNRPENSMAFEWVFRGKVPAPVKLRRDLAVAGIPVVDERGRRIDVHALRTTFGTMLSVAGVAPRVAMELMRHSDLKLTMRIYTDAGQLPLAEDVQRLPSFSVPEKDAQIHSQIHSQTGVAGGLSESQAVAPSPKLANSQDAEIVQFSPAETRPVATGTDCRMVGAVRFELTTSTSRT